MSTYQNPEQQEVPKVGLAEQQFIRRIKTGYESGYEMNIENHTPRIDRACSDQFRFNV